MQRLLGLGQLTPHELQAAVPEASPTAARRASRCGAPRAIVCSHIGSVSGRSATTRVSDRAHPEDAVVGLEQRAALHRAPGPARMRASASPASIIHPNATVACEHLRAGPVTEGLAGAAAVDRSTAPSDLGAEVRPRSAPRPRARCARRCELRRKLGERPLGERRRGLGAAGEDQGARQEPRRGARLRGILEQLVGLAAGARAPAGRRCSCRRCRDRAGSARAGLGVGGSSSARVR